MLLEVKDITVKYGGALALSGVSVCLSDGGFVALIGSNGAGKTTTLRSISGLAALESGEIWFKGKRIDGLYPPKIVSLGVAHVPEGKHIFSDMTVLDNLLAGSHTSKSRQVTRRNLNSVWEYFPVLKERARQSGGSLSGGEQQMLAIGRGIMAEPTMVLLDEPSLGLAPRYVTTVVEVMRRLNEEERIGVVLVEQNAQLALTIAEGAYVMENGHIILEGEGKALLGNEMVRKAYLGIG